MSRSPDSARRAYLEVQLRAALDEHIGAAIRITADGKLDPAEARKFETTVLAYTERAGFRLRHGFRIVLHLELCPPMLQLTVQGEDSIRHFDLADPEVWYRVGGPTDMTPAEREAQRRSFAYGNAHLSNPNVTRAHVDEAAERLAKEDE